MQFLFSSQRELHIVPNIDYFCWTITCFVSIGFIKDRINKMYPKYFNGKLWPYHLSCFINMTACTCKAWLFEKFIFELEVSNSFKITCILIRQVISLKKNGCHQQNLLFSFIDSYLYSFNPSISLMKMVSTSSKVIYNGMRVDTPGELLM